MRCLATNVRRGLWGPPGDAFAQQLAPGDGEADWSGGFLVGVGCARGEVAVFDLRRLGGAARAGGGGRPLWRSRPGDAHPGGGAVGRVAFVPCPAGRGWGGAPAEGGLLVSAARGGELRVWEAATGRLLQVVPSPTAAAWAAAGAEYGVPVPSALVAGPPPVALLALQGGVLSCCEEGAVRLHIFSSVDDRNNRDH